MSEKYSQISKIVKIPIPLYIPNCNADKIIISSYVCTKCKKFWCKNCKKFDLHKENLVHVEQIDRFIDDRREFLIEDLKNSVTNDSYYIHLGNLDELINRKISEIDIQYDKIIETVVKIKNGQINFFKDYFSREIKEVKKFNSIMDEVTFFQAKFKEIQEIEGIEENFEIPDFLRNNDILEDYKSTIIENFSEFKNKLKTFDNIYLENQNFNQKFQLQLGDKLKQSETMIKNISKNFRNRNEISKEENKEKNALLNNSDSISQCIYKVKYYNTILEWDHIKNKMSRIDNFKDKSNFKINYQVYSGNIFLNHSDKLFIVTGTNYNLFYYFDKEANEVISLPYLSNNHCRGALVYVKGINSIVCISGKYTNKCEVFSLHNFRKLNSNLSSSDVDTSHDDNKSRVNSSTNRDTDSCKDLLSLDKHYTFIDKDLPDQLNSCVNQYDLENDNDGGTMQDKSELIEIDQWQEFPQLNYQRHYSSVYLFNDSSLYVFFGYNTTQGSIDTIEKINVTNNSQSSKWEMVNYINAYSLDIRLHSHCCIYSNLNEVYIAGGVLNEKFTDKIYKYNLINNSVYLTDSIIPGINANEYYRFWEESQFIPFITYDFRDDKNDCILAMFDARNKMHLFNAKTSNYKII